MERPPAVQRVPNPATRDYNPPLVVVVNGPPGSGKTTIAEGIARYCGIPRFSKDDFKDRLFDTLGVGDREWSARLGSAAVSVMFEVARRQLLAGGSCVLENAFVLRYDEPRFKALSDETQFDVLQVWCAAPDEVLYERFHERAVTGDRHPGHLDDDVSPEDFDDLLAERKYEPMDLGGTLVCVDTTDGPDECLARVLEALEKLPAA